MIHSTSDEPAARPEGKFRLGRVTTTSGALGAIPTEEIQAALHRHHSGNWGELDKFDCHENDQALFSGKRLFSVYITTGGVRFYIITEADRSATTVLLPDEY